MSDISIRSYHPSDLEAIRRIHEENKLDFAFPNLNSPLFAVHKVLLIDEEVKAAYALRMVAEANLWLGKTGLSPEQRWLSIKALDKEAMEAARDIGIDGIQCFLPPGYDRFGRRISGKDGLGFRPDRPGWLGFSKHAGAKS